MVKQGKQPGPSLADTHSGKHRPARRQLDSPGRGDQQADRAGRGLRLWRLLLRLLRQKAAKTTRNCWEVSESGLVRTALSGQRALGSRSGSLRPRSPPAPSRPRSRPQARESPRSTASPRPSPCSPQVPSPPHTSAWPQVVLLLSSQPRALEAWPPEYRPCKPAGRKCQ